VNSAELLPPRLFVRGRFGHCPREASRTRAVS
jgi:hypothetical protein